MLIQTFTHPEPPKPGTGVRYASYQGSAPVGSEQDVDKNTETMIEIAKFARENHGVQIVAFPELFMMGYGLDPEMVKQLAEPVDGEHPAEVREAAKSAGIAVVCPYAERAQVHGETHYFDSIAVFGPDGDLRFNYRKTHLFGQAERENFTPGDGPYEHTLINDFPVGILNCYEAEFVELPRIQALKGAKFVIIPTAADFYYTKPDGKRTKVPYPDISQNLIPAQAYMNEIFVAYCNYYGYEHVQSDSWHFRGNSVLADPHGEMPLQAPHNRETLLVGDIVPGDYGPTHPAGASYLKDRRPGLYQELVAAVPGFDDNYNYGA